MTQSQKEQFWSGTSGLVLTEPNRAAFPEEFRETSRLYYYAHLFRSIEINSSFYKLPLPATFAKWSAEVPADFRFTVKLSRDITHARDLAFQPGQVEKFMQAADRIGDKKGCLLIQFPPGLTRDGLPQLLLLLENLQEHDPQHSWKRAVEFRHPSWYTATVYSLLDRFGASLVLQDMPGSTTIMEGSGATDHVYLRYHGPAGDYRGGYTANFLAHQAERITGWLTEGKTVYAYFNNTIGEAVANLQSLNKMVTG